MAFLARRIVLSEEDCDYDLVVFSFKQKGLLSLEKRCWRSPMEEYWDIRVLGRLMIGRCIGSSGLG